MARPILPKNFNDDEPFLLDIADGGYTVSIPYVCDVTGDTKYKVKACFGLGELCFFLENAVKEVEALRDQEAKV